MAANKKGNGQRQVTPEGVVPGGRIERSISWIRGQKVMLDRDLAELYGVATKVLVQAVRRNADRFPRDFAFRLTQKELMNLRSQNVTSSWGGRRYLPYAFTEQGVAMLSGVLRSPGAVHVHIEIMRALVRMRELMLTHADLSQQLEELEKKVGRHDAEIRTVFEAIRQLIEPAEGDREKRRIGFRSD